MHFSNLQIPIEGLPHIAEVELQPLEKKYLRVQGIVYVMSLVLVAAALTLLFYFVDDLHEYYLALPTAIAFIVLTIAGWVSIRLSFIYSGFALREKDLLYRSGWFNRKTRVVPLNRVQHVSVQSGPIERKYGLASVSIFTAGAGQADFTIHGITNDTALQIKEWITEQLHGRTKN